MVVRGFIKLKFFKINYLSSLFYYQNDKNPRDIFHNKLIDFFKTNFEKQEKFEHADKKYQICALFINDEYIFGKLYRLEEKQGKDFQYDGFDYIEEPFEEKDYVFNYFLISLKTHHIVIQHKREYRSGKVRWILEQWYSKFHKIEDGIDVRVLRSKKDFIRILKEAHKIIFARFVVYPSNFDWDEISKPLDEALHKRRINKLTQEMESKEGIDLELEKPNIVSSPLAQSLRGNGEDPNIKIEHKNGKIESVRHRLKDIVRQVEHTDNLEDMKKIIKSALEDVLSGLDE